MKGRLWSHRIAPSLKHWMDWCDAVGTKLLDNSLSIDEIMRHFIRPRVVDGRPNLIPLALEWPWEVTGSTSEEVKLSNGESHWPLIDVDLSIVEPMATGPISFEISTPAWSANYRLEYAIGKTTFATDGLDFRVITMRKDLPLLDFLHHTGLVAHFEKDAVVVPPGLILQPERDLPGYSRDDLTVIDWTGTDLHVESQGAERRQDSIQARMSRELVQLGEWSILMDDDGPGEIADLVAIRTEGAEVIVLLCHCKYSSEDAPGSRVADLYEVCGQAQKSVQWRRNVERFIAQLIRRESTRAERHGKTGLIIGTPQELYNLEQRVKYLRPRFEVAIAQPGLSKKAASTQVLDLLGSSAVYVHEVAGAPLKVYCSE